MKNATPKKPGRPKGSKSRINFSPFMKTHELDEESRQCESEEIEIEQYLDASFEIDEIEEDLEPSVKKSKVEKAVPINVERNKVKLHFENMKKRALEERRNKLGLSWAKLSTKLAS